MSNYNQKQAEKYGWTPEWFGVSSYGEELTQAVKEFQQKNGLTADGLCGPGTYRRKFMEMDQDGAFVLAHSIQAGDKYIVHAGEGTEIFWPKVVLWTEDLGQLFAAKHYRDLSGKPERKPNMFINHWDVCLNSASCARVLNKRQLSVHFLLDNDGTIIQCMDTQHIGFHAGRTVNNVSIGIEISSAYDLKWQDWYERKGFGKRPIWSGERVHGRTLDPFLGFYDHQVEALAALWEAVSFATGIPLELPETEQTVDSAVKSGTFKGFANHYHITAKKIDCAGLNNKKVLARALELRKNR
jgi:hypothetical protein